MSLLLQVLHVGNEADGVDDALVIEEHTRDLTGGLSVLLLDDLVDVVTDLLATLAWFKVLDALDIIRVHQLLLLLHLLLSHHLLLLGEELSLVRGHLSLSMGSCRLRLLLGRNRSRLLLLLLGLIALAASTLAHVVSVATILEIASLTVALVLLTLTLIVIVGASTMLALRLWNGAILATLVGKDGAHKVLLNFLEAALLTLLMELLSGHPELDGQRSRTKWGRLVEKLDCTLGAVDILVEDEVLTVCRLWIKVFTLAELN